MSEPKTAKSEWPKLARGPLGNTATFFCRGDVPHGWTVVGEEAKPAAPAASAPPAADGLKDARAAYRVAFGKGAGPKWDEATIRAKIATKAAA